MSTLEKRANPTQRKIMRVVKGCVKDVRNAHPEWGINDYMARSIAKRVAGTLSPLIAGELVVKNPPDRSES
jgi:hypothetical protein